MDDLAREVLRIRKQAVHAQWHLQDLTGISLPPTDRFTEEAPSRRNDSFETTSYLKSGLGMS